MQQDFTVTVNITVDHRLEVPLDRDDLRQMLDGMELDNIGRWSGIYRAWVCEVEGVEGGSVIES